MILTKEQVKEFEEAAKPLIKFLSENFHPHVQAIVDSTTAEILESVSIVKETKFLRD